MANVQVAIAAGASYTVTRDLDHDAPDNGERARCALPIGARRRCRGFVDGNARVCVIASDKDSKADRKNSGGSPKAGVLGKGKSCCMWDTAADRGAELARQQAQ